jgi:WD40 repeat protein
LGAAFDVDSSTLVVATRKDIRIYSAHTGRLCDVYQVVGEDEISVFTLGLGRRFIVGTDKGEIKLFSKTGELISSFQGHTNEVTEIKQDTLNKLLITASWDSDVFVWR